MNKNLKIITIIAMMFLYAKSGCTGGKDLGAEF